MDKKQKLIAIVGPTASGKEQCCHCFGKKKSMGEIVSADSAQVYRGLDIGTAKVTEEEAQRDPASLD